MANQISIPSTKFNLQSGDTIRLKSSDDQYLKVVEYSSDRMPLELSNDGLSKWNNFWVTVTDESFVLLQCVANGNYLSYINRGINGNPIEADKEQSDQYCLFTPVMIWSTNDNFNLAFYTNANSLFWTTIERNNQMVIEADLQCICTSCFFGIEFVTT